MKKKIIPDLKRQRIIKDKRKILKVTRMMMEGKKIGNMDGILLGNNLLNILYILYQLN